MHRPSLLCSLWLVMLPACTEDPMGEGTSTPWGPSTTEAGDTLAPTSDEDTTAGDTSASTSIGTSADTTAGDEDPGTTGEPECIRPDPSPTWMAPLQQDVVARLSGAAEVSPGVVLSDRASPGNRAATLDFLLEQWDAMGLEGTLHPYSATGTNVYVALPAAIETDLTVVIGAHFDSVPGCPGANDNATGVAMVLSLSRWLDAIPCRELNVILVLFDEEEIGLVGSQAFASWLVEQSFDVHSVHTIDQMGWDGDGDRTLELERADEGLFELYEAAEPLAPGNTPLTPTNTGFTDHVSFRELGFPAIGLTEEYVSGDTTPHYHLPSDTFDTVDLDYLGSSTALLHVTLGQLVAPTAR